MLEGTAAPRFRIHSPLLTSLRARFGKILLLVLAAVAPILLLRTCAFTYVAPNEVGIRQVAYGPGKGLQKSIVEPGYRREIFGYETVRTFPRDLQAVEFTDNAAEGSKDHKVVKAVNVPTVDGYPVTIDVTVVYRIADPFQVVRRFGFGRGYEEGVVIRFTDPSIKQYLGALRAEEFYRHTRLRQVALMKKDLTAKFKENGLELTDVLIRQYDYPATFQDLTEQKKIQDQSVLANREFTKQAEVQTRLNQVSAEGKNLMNLKTAEFQAQITGINAQKDLYERQKRAEADLLVRAAEASGTELINRAMEGSGSDKLLRLKKGLAILNGIKGPIYITDDPTDLGRIVNNRN